MNTDDRFIQIDRLFHEGLDHSGPERDAWLDGRADVDPGIRAEVREMLVADDRINDLTAAFNEPIRTAIGAQDHPDRLGEFRLLERIGSGGMGVVFLAEQTSIGRKVALKVVRREHLLFADTHLRFRREAEAIAQLKHPNIVPIHVVGETDGVPYIAMEWIEGRSLGDVLHELGDRTPEELTGRTLAEAVGVDTGDDLPALFAGSWEDACVGIARQVALALQHAHGRGVLHRDVKPSNVMIARDGRALLVDFGVAQTGGGQTVGGQTRLTRTGSQLGSLPYMAPEQVGNDAECGPQVDVYGLGVLLFESLTLRLPLQGPTPLALSERILGEEAPPARRSNPAISRDLSISVATALQKEPARRYASARAFGEDLERTLRGDPILARPLGPVERVWRWARRRPARAGMVMTSSVMVVAVVVLAWRWPEMAAARERAQAEKLEELLTHGFFELAEGSPAAATRSLKAALNLAPRSPEAVAGYALSLVRAKRLDDASQFLEGASDLRAQVPALEWVRAAVLREKGDEEAATQLETGLPDPAEPLSFFLKAVRQRSLICVRRTAVREEAIELLERGRSLSVKPRMLFLCELAHALGHAPAGEYRERRRELSEYLRETWGARSRMARYWSAFVLSDLDSEEKLAALRQARPIPAASRKLAWLLRRRKPDEAETIARQLYEENAGSSPNLITFGEVLASRGKTEEAISMWRSAVAKDSNVARHNLANALYRRREFAAAEKLLRESDLDNSNSLNLLGMIRRRRGDLGGAEANYRAALEMDAKNQPAVSNLANVLEQQDRKDEAFQLRKANAQHGDLPQLHGNLANDYLKRNRFSEAASHYRRVLRTWPDHAETHYYLGAALYSAGLSREAIPVLQRAIRLAPRDKRPKVVLANAQIRMGDFQAAAATIERIENLRGLSPRTRSAFAMALRGLGRAEESLLVSRAIYKESPSAAVDLHAVLRELGRLEEAASVLRERLRADPRRLMDRHALASVLWTDDHRLDSLAEFLTATVLGTPSTSAQYRNIADALFTSGNPTSAEVVLRVGLERIPGSSSLHHALGYHLYRTHRHPQAIVAFQKALQIKSDAGGTHCRLAESLRLAGKYDAAHRHLEQGHELGSRTPVWKIDSAKRLRRIERVVKGIERCRLVLAGEATPRNTEECLELARVAWEASLPAGAVQLYQRAIAEDAEGFANIEEFHRACAARAAVAAGCGRGLDGLPFESEDAARLRGLALRWLEEEIDACRLLPEDTTQRAAIHRRLDALYESFDLRDLRDRTILARMVESERSRVEAMWRMVDTMRARKDKR